MYVGKIFLQLGVITASAFLFILEKPKYRQSKSDVITYLSHKREADTSFRSEELKYKRDALEVESKLRQEALEMEKKRIALQERQMEMQMELIKALIEKK